MPLSPEELSALRMFQPQTYAINLDRPVGKSLAEKGLVEWVPPVWGNSPNWAITDAGRETLTKLGSV